MCGLTYEAKLIIFYQYLVLSDLFYLTLDGVGRRCLFEVSGERAGTVLLEAGPSCRELSGRNQPPTRLVFHLV